MPPKKDAAGGEVSELIAGFSEKECKLLSAAFISCTGPDKYDYELMATLTKNTVGSLKKMWPPVKKKAMEAHPSFAVFLGQASTAAVNGEAKVPPALKTAAGKKRKAAEENEDDKDPASDGGKSEDNKPEDHKPDNTKKKVTPKKAPAAKGRGRPKKVAKKEPTSDDEAQAQAENSADGGDGVGEFVFVKNVVNWLNGTDEEAGQEIEDDA